MSSSDMLIILIFLAKLNLVKMNRRQFDRQDVKARTMSKFSTLDPDIASRYEDLDEDDPALRYRGGSRQQRGRSSLPRKMLGVIESHIDRKDRSMMRTAGAGSSRRELLNKIIVRNASRSGKDHVLKLLADAVDQFLPISPRMDENGDLSFIVLSEDDAQAIESMSKRIADKHNPSLKYVIYKKKIPAPFEPLSASMRQVIEQILKSRFNQTTNSLDLSSFQNDQMFERSHEMPKGLFHNNVMVNVATYVANNFPNIRGIRLNNNSLRTLDFVSALVYAAPKVIELDLSNNSISRVDELAKLSGWQLESVHFENNEFITNFQGNSVAYTNAIHEYFPRVTYLDGLHVNMAANALTSTSTSTSIPKFKPGFHTDESLRKMTENFLLEYYTYYDGPNGEENRQKLVRAYDSNATFSYTICILSDTKYLDKGDPEVYQQYMRNSHNIVNQQKWQSFRDRLLFRGPMDIAVALSKLPLTEHVKQSFLLDFNMVSNNLMVVSLQGIFRDGKNNIGAGKRTGDFKFFVRQFAIIPRPEGLAILSDILQITPVSTQRMEHYNNLLKNATQADQKQIDGMAPPPPSPQMTQEAALMTSSAAIKMEPSTSAAAIYNASDPSVRSEMIKQFCAYSRMKPEWAEKCLQDCAWNWEEAKRAFTNMRGQIPPEAFAP